ncbi:MAG: helix-turn-helix domain-containing protein, partial [Alphaproteobacteria bacterium]
MAEMMTTREVADYLRIKQRKVYDLVSEREIPCTRVTGKWLFPKHLIDLWVLQATEGALPRPRAAPPPIIAGSQDPLLDWALQESDS